VCKERRKQRGKRGKRGKATMFSSNMNFDEGKQFLGEPKNKNLIFALCEASGEKGKAT
jgi:hypothetical protein